MAVVDPPQWWVGAGLIRDVVREVRFARGVARPAVKDIDVAFVDPHDLTPARENNVASRLRQRDASLSWDAKNQAAVHLWYPRRFGIDAPPFASVPDAVATWPEYATCVAVRHSSAGTLDVCAPHGLDDLLDGVWRRNPAQVTVEEYRRRVERKQLASRWPAVCVIP